MDERDFLRGMYRAGAAPYFEVLGAHPYGFGLPPDAPAEANNGLVFDRLVDQRAIMLNHDSPDKLVWITEMGWSVSSPPDQPDIGVSPAQQAAYLVGAIDRIRGEWPWVALATVWNLSLPEPGDEFGGYSLIDPAGAPRPAYETLRQAVQGRKLGVKKWLQETWIAVPGARGQVQPSLVSVLAEDAIVHLGDSDLASPWWPLYGGRKPSIEWTGGFYLHNPGASDWTLALELMQQNEVGAAIIVNGVALAPDLPQGDFARRWLSVRRRVPVSTLRPGYNELVVIAARLAPDLQHDEFTWDDFQIRNVRLVNSTLR
jgi:hypothetical protein